MIAAAAKLTAIAYLVWSVASDVLLAALLVWHYLI